MSRVAVGLLALGLMAPGLSPASVGASDVTAPTLISAQYLGAHEFVSDDTNNQLYLTMQQVDNLSGVATPLLRYISPSGHQSAGGTVNNAVGMQYDMNVYFPAYSETGVWVPEFTLSDLSGNTTVITNTALLARGIDLRATLTGTGDTTAPVLTSATMASSNTADAGLSTGGNFAINMTISDDLAGMTTPTIYYTSPSGNQSQGAGWSFQNGQWLANVSTPQYSETGTWTPTLIVLDAVGNSRTYTDANLLAMGFNIRFTLTGTTDVTPPTINDLSIGLSNPIVDNIGAGSAVITVYASFSDNLSGVGGVTHLSYLSPSGHQHADAQLSGTDANGVWQWTTFMPTYSEAGVWDPTLYLVDAVGNSHTYHGAELASLGFPIALNITKNVTKTAVAGETVTSDVEGDGATTTDPVEVSVTTPNAGDVSIVIVASDAVADPTNGYTFFDRQLSIAAPGASVANPLTLDFMIDSSKVPAGESAQTLQVTRNGAAIAACANQTTANPDPCVFSRTTTAGGDIDVKVHSTTASSWASGFPTHTFDFKGFKKPIKAYPAKNDVDPGQAIPVSFKLAGVKNTSFITEGQPTTQRVNCNTLALMGQEEAAVSTDHEGFQKEGKVFEYDWKTKKTWRNTCRIFSVKFTDNSVHSAVFEF
jgi:hypothetical protein